MNLTHPLRREDLIEAVRAVLADRERSGASPYDIEVMRATAEALEASPLASTAEQCVSLIVADLLERKGFAELIASLSDFSDTRKFWIELIQRTVKAPPPRLPKLNPPAQKQESIDLDFSPQEDLEFS